MYRLTPMGPPGVHGRVEGDTNTPTHTHNHGDHTIQAATTTYNVHLRFHMVYVTADVTGSSLKSLMFISVSPCAPETSLPSVNSTFVYGLGWTNSFLRRITIATTITNMRKRAM
eukprot:TRINITY_DN5685_c1_g1_i1.p3 TRINITY_DN5685_c1_g1~~TRINITY_DN5685_c1_g1_i1.p3  ORF type:complete len:114 (-),score=6.08 TRINITY_DN5685_c1_g1_i1:74-415(-)